MIPVLVLTHGDLAVALLDAAQTIDPHLGGRNGGHCAALGRRLGSGRERLVEDSGCESSTRARACSILTDMFGGTATNLALPFLDPDRVEIVTGVNLPDAHQARLAARAGAVRSAELGQDD